MAYCEHEKRHRYCIERENNNWNQNARDYISYGKWNYSFTDEASVSDCEQSFLSRFVFAALMNSKAEDIPTNKILIKVDDVTYHFDVMNNFSDHIFEKGFKYTIGNFAPIPAVKFSYITKNGTKTQAHLQLIHKWKNEKWDGVLGTLKANWKKYVGKSDFAEYMISTCQQLYFQEIFDEFYDPNLDLERVDWNKKTKEWNERIRGQKDLNIITLEGINASRPEIEFLIEARGRCILNCLHNS